MFDEWRVLLVYFAMWAAVLMIAGGVTFYTIGVHNVGIAA